MKFILSYDFPKTNRETLEKLTYIDYRTVKTIEEAKARHWFKRWFESGENHREEKGKVACDRLEKSAERVIDIDSISELIALQEKHGDIVIMDANYREIGKEIGIYC